MEKATIVKHCKELGCCDACCIRYLGVKNPSAYENSGQFVLKYLDQPSGDSAATPQTANKAPNPQTAEKAPNPAETASSSVENTEKSSENTGSSENIKEKIPEDPKEAETKSCENNETVCAENEGPGAAAQVSTNGCSSPPAKRKKTEVCVSCLGILQESSWQQAFDMVKEQLDRKRYECDSFACALSAPIATMLREKVITVSLGQAAPSYDSKCVTPLKEAWKWSFGERLARHVGLALQSGSSSALLVTITMEYDKDLDELEVLKQLSPGLFAARAHERRRFAVQFTRRSVEQALEQASWSTLAAAGSGSGLPPLAACSRAAPVSVVTAHTPLYLAGRYMKLSRALPQTPWLAGGARVMESSVQETIFEPLAKAIGMSPEEAESRLKFMSAGREDVDVRCLGDGRPFALEILDPSRRLSPEELSQVCGHISRSGRVRVTQLVYVSKEDLAQLKKGEETKTKTYEALCIKLTHSKHDDHQSGPPVVSADDIARIDSYRNTPDTDEARVTLQQRTPLRVLHRRPLLTRTRRIYQLSGQLVPDHPQLFLIRLSTEAGTYVKEWCHAEWGRTAPALRDVLGARADILALDVVAVHLDWPHYT